MLINAEQVSAPTALSTRPYPDWHERGAVAGGSSAKQWASAEESMGLGRWTSVEHQLSWQSEAGFVDSDCLLKDHRFVVLAARRAGESTAFATTVENGPLQ